MTQRRRRARAAAAPKRDISAPAYRRFDRMVMRPDDALFVAGVVVGSAVFAWLVAIW